MDYAFRMLQRVSRQAELNPHIRHALERIRSRFQQGGAVPKVLPDQFEVRVAQWGGELMLVGAEVDAPFASWPQESWLATLRARGPKVAIETVTFEEPTKTGSTWQTVEVGGHEVVKLALPEQGRLKVRTDCEGVTLAAAPRSPSAVAAGRDRFGLWEETEIAGTTGKPVPMRWRWISPGTFWMGSPEDEPGRWEDEGPRHLVTLTQGFWMAETPCTQELWQSVLGKNPSRFQDKPQHPVERVSFRDVEQFCKLVNKGLRDEEVGLPTEAQWEYACRAGSPGAVYRVPGSPEQFLIDQKNNAAALEAIAWYSKTAGGATHSVCTKLPNAWGLYDMLGNVYEWCRDAQRRYDSQAATDPVGAGESRVIRGGSWGSDARGVRCAYRDQYPVEDQYSHLGFRLVRVQKS
jgi:formylglycine-generating enzyme required for sulfatase activity